MCLSVSSQTCVIVWLNVAMFSQLYRVHLNNDLNACVLYILTHGCGLICSRIWIWVIIQLKLIGLHMHILCTPLCREWKSKCWTMEFRPLLEWTLTVFQLAVTSNDLINDNLLSKKKIITGWLIHAAVQWRTSIFYTKDTNREEGFKSLLITFWGEYIVEWVNP